MLSCETGQKSRKSFNYEVSCIGRPSARNQLVYLHGFDGEQLGPQEQRNRKNLRRLAKMLNLRIAIPRSPKACYRKAYLAERCWSEHMSREEGLEALAFVKKAAAECFPNSRNFGLLAFSNAGYLATKIFTHCLLPGHAPEVKYIVTAGSSRLWGSVKRNGRSLQNCRPITFIAGKRDHANYESSQKYFSRLEDRGAQISIVVFNGGHELPFGPTLAALRKYLR